jgi:glycosyltransferase involved in cell wall biosynthesis
MINPPVCVSIVCPAYREEDGLASFHDRLARVLDRLEGPLRFEVLYIDDGSTDGTLVVMRHLAAQDTRVRYLSLSRNFGKEAALLAGLENASGSAVVTLDTDLQHPPEVIADLVATWQQGWDVVTTERQQMRYRSRLHALAAGLFHRFMQRLTPGRVCTSDFQLLSRRAVDAVLRMPEANRYHRALVGWIGFPTAVVPFRVEPRHAGVSSFTPARLMRLAADAIVSTSQAPLRIPLYAGLASGLLGAGHALVVLVLGVLGAVRDWLAHAILVALLLLGGAILLSLGILGEYLGRTFEQVKRRPLYLVKESSPGLALAEKDSRRAA